MTERLRSLAVVGLVALGCAPASAQTIRVSVATDGTLSNDSSLVPTVSETGRFIAFLSFATNLVAGDTNGASDIFLRDRDTDADGVFDEAGSVSTIRVSQRGGVEANGPSFHPVLTPNGRFVFFESAATNLFSTGQPPLTFTQILRWDRLSGEIVLVSRNDAGEPLNERAFWPAPTDDGTVVYFITYASNGPVAAIGAGGMLVRRDIPAGTLTGWSDPLPTTQGLPTSIDQPSVSGDGRIVVYGIAQRNPVAAGERVGGTIVVRTAGEADRTFAGVAGQVSRDGAFLLGVELPAPGNTTGAAFRVHLRSGERRILGPLMFSLNYGTAASPSGRYMQGSTAFFADFVHGSWLANFLPREPVAFDGFDQALVYTRSDLTAERQFNDLFVVPLTTFFDNDSDGLNDHWEMLFGLNAIPNAAGGAAGDPDSDGLTNTQEFAAGSNPVGTQKRFLAEGTSSADFFSTRVAIVNPGSVDAKVAVRFDAGEGVGVSRALMVPARARVTLDSHAELMDGFSFSTVVDSDQPLVVDRLVSWGTAAAGIYGSHAETSTAAPGTSWFLAEGSTVLGFQLFYLLQNPGAVPTQATIRFLLPTGAPVVRTYPLPAHSRSTIFVNTIPGLESTDVSAEITATQPIAVERAMYRSPNRLFELGHAAAAVAAPNTTWLFAEGSSNAFFDTYLLLANPSATAATVTVDYLRDAGAPVTRQYTVAAGSRFSEFVDGVPGLDATSYGIRVSSSVPVVAERAMYWAGGFFDYYEGHVSTGVTQHGSRWILAEGEQNGRLGAQTFVLIANVSNIDLPVRVRTLPEGTGTPNVSAILNLPAGARMTIPASHPQLLAEGRFGIEVSLEGTNVGGLVVEGAMYWSVGEQVFAAGAAWPATRID